MPYLFSRLALLVLPLLILCGLNVLKAQEPPRLLRYRFHKGDSVVYRIHAADSIALYDVRHRLITRQRISLVSYRCDSVLQDGSFIMTWQYHAYTANERLDAGAPITRETHPWVGRSATFRMTPGGLRTTMYRWSSTPETSPGGPIEPLPLPWIGDDTLAPEIPGSTSYSGKNWLFENSFPPTLWDGIMMRIADPISDTLGRRVLPIELSVAGSVAYGSRQGEDSILTQAIIQSGGNFKFGVKEGYPLSGQMDMIARLKLTIGDGRQQREVEGRHRMTTVYELLWPKPLTAPKSRRPARPRRSR